MERNLTQLGTQPFDVLIIGAGIHGAAIAREAAQSGYKTALIEQNDFSHATSANSLKIIHGGLRYLQHLDIKRMRESIISRKEMLHIAPALVKPLECIIPLYSSGIKGKTVMRIALFLNDIISSDRNKNCSPDNYLPKGHILSKEQCLKLLPTVDKNRLKGAAVWYDAIAMNTERLTLVFIKEAYKHGAMIANYCEATHVSIQDNSIKHVEVKDCLTGQTFSIQSKIVVNATGPWFEKFLVSNDVKPDKHQNWAKATNIIVKKSLFSNYAVGLEGEEAYIDKDAILKKGKRFYFFVPFRGYTMIGTNYSTHHGDPAQFEVQKEDVEKLLDATNKIYPDAKLTFNDVTRVHAGILPVKNTIGTNEFDIQLEKNTEIIDHQLKHGIKGLISVKGVKYTTAPQAAKKVMQIINPYFETQVRKKNTDKQHPSVVKTDLKANETIKSLSAEIQSIIQHLKVKYGTDHEAIVGYIMKDEGLGCWISHHPKIAAAEIIYFIHHEMAVKLSDIILRRTDLGSAECPPIDLLETAADVMGAELKWDTLKKKEEVDHVLEQYSPLRFEHHAE